MSSAGLFLAAPDGFSACVREAAGAYLLTHGPAEQSSISVELVLLTALLGLCSSVERVSSTQHRVRIQNRDSVPTDANFSFTLSRTTIGLPAGA